jgi:ubiquinone/menaquinone biosynthesis C-methylase UbiE
MDTDPAFSSLLRSEFAQTGSNNAGYYDFSALIAGNLPASESAAFYGARVSAYEENLHLTFDTHFVHEESLRRELIQNVITDSTRTILDLGGGTGRDAVLIDEYASPGGVAVLHDASESMLGVAKSKLSSSNLQWRLVHAPAAPLIYRDESFDCVYSFGGFNEFGDARTALAEIVRVTKVGGKILLVDEGFAPWLRDSEIYRVLSLTNAQFHAEAPIASLPSSASAVQLSWLMNGSFWCLALTRGTDDPHVNFDLAIPGERGGTHRSRYFGSLEGVEPNLRSAVYELAKNRGLSRYAALTEALTNWLHSDGRQHGGIVE